MIEVPGLNIVDTETEKNVSSKQYNYTFNKITGFFQRWGENKEDDPQWAPAPEILDIEVSEICNGINGKPCTFCYKSNTNKGSNMSFDTFKTIIDKYPRTLTQIAIGIGDINSNPDLFKMFEYCRNIGIVPNITINGDRMTPELYDNLVRYAGAVAVSNYDDDICFNAVKELTSRGLKQVNIHKLLSENTYQSCLDLTDKVKSDERLKQLKSIVFLYLKPKGKRNNFEVLKSFEDYCKLIDICLLKEINFGFDSCSASHFMDYLNMNIKLLKESMSKEATIFNELIKNRINYFNKIKQYVEPCESDCFSSYINVFGKYYHCSFTEDQDGWEGIDMLKINNFIDDVWNHPETVKFREKLLISEKQFGCRKCPIFDLSFKE